MVWLEDGFQSDLLSFSLSLMRPLPTPCKSLGKHSLRELVLSLVPTGPSMRVVKLKIASRPHTPLRLCNRYR
jgi:hypothetical protein